MQYAQNILNVFSSIFDIFVSLVVSVYVLLQRAEIMKFFNKLAKRVFNKKIYYHIDKYFGQANEMFFKFVGSQVIDAFIVGILTTIAMSIIGVKYAPLLGFMIGLFNLIPYIGAIVAVAVAILITFITISIYNLIIILYPFIINIHFLSVRAALLSFFILCMKGCSLLLTALSQPGDSACFAWAF